MPETPTPSANVRRSATRRANAKARKAMGWFTGSNGNLFCDAGGFRYCIAREDERYGQSGPTYSYSVARNGAEIARVGSLADARRVVWLESLKIDGPKKHVTEECGPDCLSGCAVCS